MRLLGDAQCEHTILQVGVDARRVEFTAQREAAAVTGYAHFGVHRLETVGRRLQHTAFDEERIARIGGASSTIAGIAAGSRA